MKVTYWQEYSAYVNQLTVYMQMKTLTIIQQQSIFSDVIYSIFSYLIR